MDHQHTPLWLLHAFSTSPSSKLTTEGVSLLQLGVPKSPNTPAKNRQDAGERCGVDHSRLDICFLQQAISGGESNR